MLFVIPVILFDFHSSSILPDFFNSVLFVIPVILFDFHSYSILADFQRPPPPPLSEAKVMNILYFYMYKSFPRYRFLLPCHNRFSKTNQSVIQSQNFLTFNEPRNRFQEIDSASLCSLAGRHDNPNPARFLAPTRLF